MTRPNILLLYSDEHSFRYMGHVSEGCGGEPIETPAFDRLASEGTVFTDAYCQMPLCTPSRICMLTGREVRGCGAWSNNSVLRPELPTMPGTFRDAGYATCLVGKMHLGGTQQFVGYQNRPYGDLTGKTGHQWEPFPEPATGMRARTRDAVGVTKAPESLIIDEVVCHETVAYLREHQHANPDQPWFLTASFSRPHFPLTAPRRHLDRFWPEGVTEPRIGATGDAYDHPMSVGMRKGFRADDISHEEMMFARACYFACVTYLDEIIADLRMRLDADGLLDNTIIVYTTDHGELAGEHGVWWKNGWYEGCTRVPMILSTPEQRRGEVSPAECSTPMGIIDLFPTLAGLAGVECPSGVDGVDLSETITKGAPAPDRPVFCDALNPRWGAGTEFRSIRRGKYKYVRFRNAPPLAFDLDADPGEQHNLLAVGGELPQEINALEEVAMSSIDFDEAERERKERDGGLAKQYKQTVERSNGNAYLMPNGTLVDGDDVLYRPSVLAKSLKDAFGEDWQEQNRQ